RGLQAAWNRPSPGGRFRIPGLFLIGGSSIIRRFRHHGAGRPSRLRRHLCEYQPMTPPHQPYDAVLLLSFGGPERPEDVIPFLENVLRGKNVPRERMMEVAEHYNHFGGKSPINEQNRELIAAVEADLQSK